MVVRPIGPLVGSDFAARVVEFYHSLDSRRMFNRIIDPRRYDSFICNADLDHITSGWARITPGVDYRTKVTMVVRDAHEKLLLAEVSARFLSAISAIFMKRWVGC